MSESDCSISILETIKDLRETETDLAKLDIPELQARAGSNDLQLAAAARSELLRKWDVQPELEAQSAETIDLMRLMERYSHKERKKIASQLVALQLTQGCNGSCPFCLFGLKKGVTAKFSYYSIVAFLNQYQNQIPANLNLYWDSDPFDYQADKHNITDIFKAWRGIKPKEYQYFSTTIPRGSQDNFLEFMTHAALEHKAGRESDRTLQIRLSIARHNVQRVEACLKILASKLEAAGLTGGEIDAFFNDCLRYGNRIDPRGIQNVGPLVDRRDDIREIYSGACRDGSLITPGGVKGIVLTTPSVYEPSGQADIPVDPGQVKATVPHYTRVFDYSEFVFDNSLRARTLVRRTMLPKVRQANGKLLELPNQVENSTLHLGREVAAIGRLMIDFSDLVHENVASKPERVQRRYLKVAARVYRKRARFTRAQVEKTKRMIAQGEFSSEEIEQLEYYILLTETYLAEMDFVVDQIEAGRPVLVICAIANLLRRVGREQLPHLPKIIESVFEVGQLVESGSVTSSIEIRENLIQRIGKLFDIEDFNEDESVPQWVRGFSDAFLTLAESEAKPKIIVDKKGRIIRDKLRLVFLKEDEESSTGNEV